MKKLGMFFLMAGLWIGAAPAQAREGLCDYSQEWCSDLGVQSSSAPAYPSASSKLNLNPSAVPTEDVWGIQGLEFKNEWDLSLVKGTGRIGAGLTLTNNEESFFGPPAFELPPDYLARRIAQEKYNSQKLTLATAGNLYSNRKDGLQKLQLNVGVLGRYNKATGSIWPGAGVSGVAGPFTFGYAVAKDEVQEDFTSYGLPGLKYNYRYNTETYSGGIFLSSLAVDYSHLNVYTEDNNNVTIEILTGSLYLKRWIFTIATRAEDSQREAYDPVTQTLVTQRIKRENFAGVQFQAFKFLMIGLFYNYYLLHDGSLGLTAFF